MHKRTARGIPLMLLSLLLSATASRGQADPVDDTRQLDGVRPIERTMRGGEVHRYQISLTAGHYLNLVVDQRGIDVVVIALGPDGTMIREVDSPNGSQGPEPLDIVVSTSGMHRFEVRSLEAGASPGRYEIRVRDLLTAEQYEERLAEESARDEAIVDQLRRHAIRLESITAGSGFEDLRPLRKILSGARVVGLGEATHGTREFFQVRHRLLEFLVEEMGYTVLAVEGSYAAFERINDYVVHGTGDRATLLAEQGYWILDTEEVAAIIDWLREHNRAIPDEKKVRIFGIDANANKMAMTLFTEYLAKVAPDRAPAAEALFNRIRPQDLNAISFARTEVPAAHLSELYKLISYMVLNKAGLVRNSSVEEFDRALQHIRLVAQFAEFNSQEPVEGGGTRDGYMAENFQHIVNREKPGTRFVVLAHNAHISRRGTGRYPAMGSYLGSAFGARYYAFGFAFNRGSFQAQVAGDGKPRVEEFTLGAAPKSSVDWYLARAGIPSYVLDLDRLSKNSEAGQWLRTELPMHWIGAIFSDKWVESQWTRPFVLDRDFDGLIFIEHTSRARPTATGRRTGM
jgi:erythromycin esterase